MDLGSATKPRRRAALLWGLGAGVATLGLAGGALAQSATCESLVGFKLDGGVVETATPLAASDVVALGKSLPALPVGAPFCRVHARLKPTPSSDIQVEIWLPPATAWNGKLLGAGNGGYGGGFVGPFLTMRTGLARGYAAAGTDMGHTAAGDIDAKWALNQPEKIKDFGYRANHVTAVAAKALVRAYYGSPQKQAYFHGCSDGGREALMEAWRFPDDYDGIIAGAPANPWTRLMSGFQWTDREALGRPGGALPNAKLAIVQSAVLKQCDKLDGVADGVVDDPRLCRFDPAVLQCKAGDAADCLTPAQVNTVRVLHRGTVGRDGRALFNGYPPGGEAIPGAWDSWITGPDAQHGRYAAEFFKWMVFGDAGWDPAKSDIERDLKTAQSRVGDTLDAGADLRPFAARGGKLLLYHGWADAAIAPGATIDYYNAVGAKAGASAKGFTRLFMVPGMSHCFAGPGPNVFDALGAMDGWKETGTAPERLVATKYDNDLLGYIGFPSKAVRTRPLCAYPKVARWDGKGSVDAAASFTCVAPKAR
jgi:feruloyl esterase